MAARDHYTINIKCHNCGAAGVADVSEDDHPYMKHPGFNIDRLPTGFKVLKDSNYQHETQIGCECGATFSLQAS